MKRINYAGGTLETGDAVAAAIVEYVKAAAQTDPNITVEIPVRESRGDISKHTILLGPSAQLDVSDSAVTVEGEADMFPIPDFGRLADVATVESLEEADRSAREFDRAVAEIERNLDEGSA